MQRKNKPIDPNDTRPRWKKLSGKLKIHGRIVLPGQIFRANFEEIPEVFRDTCQCLDPLPNETVMKAVKTHVIRERKETPVEVVIDGSKIAEAVTEQAPAPPESDNTELEIKPRSPGWFDIVNIKTGKVLNENALRKADAERILKELEGV